MWTIENGAKKSMEDYIMANPMVVPITMIRNGIDGRDLGIDSIYVAYSSLFFAFEPPIRCMVFKYYEAQVVKKL